MLSRFNSSIHRALTRISYDRNRPRQSINQPINQAINQSIKQPIDRSINRWIEAGGYLGAVSITSVAIAREQRQQLLELEVGDRWRRRCRSRRRCRGEPRLVHGAERHACYDEASSIVPGVWLRVGYSTLQAWVLRGDTVDLAAVSRAGVVQQTRSRPSRWSWVAREGGGEGGSMWCVWLVASEGMNEARASAVQREGRRCWG